MRQIESGGDPEAIALELPGHARWLVAVYNGLPLTPEWCRGGSRFHARVLQQYGGVLQPARVLTEIRDLPDRLRNLYGPLKPLPRAVVRNLAVDETMEQLGRRMSG